MADIKRMPKLYMLNFFWLSTPTCQKHGFRIRNSVDMTADDRDGVFLVIFKQTSNLLVFILLKSSPPSQQAFENIHEIRIIQR